MRMVVVVGVTGVTLLNHCWVCAGINLQTGDCSAEMRVGGGSDGGHHCFCLVCDLTNPQRGDCSAERVGVTGVTAASASASCVSSPPPPAACPPDPPSDLHHKVTDRLDKRERDMQGSTFYLGNHIPLLFDILLTDNISFPLQLAQIMNNIVFP